MAAQRRKRPGVTEPVAAIVEGESVGDLLLYDGRSYRIVEVYDWRVFVKALGVLRVRVVAGRARHVVMRLVIPVEVNFCDVPMRSRAQVNMCSF